MGNNIKTKHKWTPRLAFLISGVLLVSVVIVSATGGWLVQRTFEDRLIAREIGALAGLSSSWAGQFSSWLEKARSSIDRYAEAVSEPYQKLPSRIRSFDTLVERQADGAWRSVRKTFDPAHEAGIWLQKEHPLTEETKQFFIRTKEVTDLFGLGLLIGTLNTWTLPKEGGIIIFWPSFPEWVYGASADLDYTTTDWVTLTRPDRNPRGLPRWTPTSYDPAASMWMISIVAPFFRDGQWAGAVGHDLPISGLNSLIKETTVYPGTRHMLVRRDGTILTSDEHQAEVEASSGHFRISDLKDDSLIQYFDAIAERLGAGEESYLHFSRDIDQIILANHIAATDWILLTTIPAEAVLATLRDSFRTVGLVATAALMILCLIPALFISWFVVPQVRQLVQGTREIAQGNLDFHFDLSSSREFTQIGAALNEMVAQLRENIYGLKEAGREIVELNKELENRVSQRTAELEAANKELEAFSYSVSHDLRAPLRAITGFSGILLEEGEKVPSELQKYLTHISDSGIRMELLINDLLQFSRLSKKELREGPVDLAQSFRDKSAELLAENKDRTIDCHIDDLETAWGDVNLLQQVVSNLLENAFKYTRGRDRAIIEVGNNNHKGRNVYFVRDNGAGFDMRYSDKLFGVFQRLHAADEFEGTGIGLALVKRIISRHGGQVWAEAEIGKGATFYFTLAEENDSQRELNVN